MEKRKRKNYTDDVKREAVKLVNEQGYRISEAARNLGIHESVLRRWVTAESSSEYHKTPAATHAPLSSATPSAIEREQGISGQGNRHSFCLISTRWLNVASYAAVEGKGIFLCPQLLAGNRWHYYYPRVVASR